MVLGQLRTVLAQSAHREPASAARPAAALAAHYRLLPQLRTVLGGGGGEGGGGGGGGPPPPSLPPSVRASLDALRERLGAAAASAASDLAVSPAGWGGLWFGLVHGDLHGGNVMVDSRSYAWLIDYADVEDAHVRRSEQCPRAAWGPTPLWRRLARAHAARRVAFGRAGT